MGCGTGEAMHCASQTFRTLFLATALMVAGTRSPAAAPVISVAPEIALTRLKEGNMRFAKAEVSSGKPTAARRRETVLSQAPFAAIVGCSDSRTAPEILFDQNLGDLFVVRTAGQVVDTYALGSLEYAVEHLGVRLIVVLGHERCGALQAAVDGDSAPGHLGALVADLQPSVRIARGQPGDLVANAIHEHVREVAAKIRREARFGEFGGQVQIVVGSYDPQTGKVGWTVGP